MIASLEITEVHRQTIKSQTPSIFTRLITQGYQLMGIILSTSSVVLFLLEMVVLRILVVTSKPGYQYRTFQTNHVAHDTINVHRKGQDVVSLPHLHQDDPWEGLFLCSYQTMYENYIYYHIHGLNLYSIMTFNQKYFQ